MYTQIKRAESTALGKKTQAAVLLNTKKDRSTEKARKRATGLVPLNFDKCYLYETINYVKCLKR